MSKVEQLILKTTRQARAGSINLAKRRLWFDDDANEDDDVAKDENQEEDDPEDDPPKTISMTQAELDDLLQKRIARAQKSATAKLLKELGVENEEALRANLTALQEIKNSELSDLETAQQEVVDKDKLIATLTADNDTLEKAAHERTIINALHGQASSEGAVHPDDVISRIKSMESVKFDELLDDDGIIDEKTVKKLIALVKKDRPNFFKNGSVAPGNGPHGDGKQNVPDAQQKKDALQANVKRVKNAFR